MATLNFNFKSLFDFQAAFPTEQACVDFLVERRWPNGVVSPFDPTSKVWKTRVMGWYRCKNTRKDFSVRTGTMFEYSRIPLRKWFLAIFLITSRPKGISSLRLAKDLGIGETAAWFMLHRIRGGFTHKGGKLSGKVEIDETFVGGKNKNRHKCQKLSISQGRSFADKVAVLGMMERDPNGGGKKVVCSVTVDTKTNSLTPPILATVDKSAEIYHDEWRGYRKVDAEYKHAVVDHGHGIYVEAGGVYTNTIEGFWGTYCKRAITGTYNHISGAHMHRYFDEFAYRYNNRKVSDNDTFVGFFDNIEHRLKYTDLIKEHRERNREPLTKLANEQRKQWRKKKAEQDAKKAQQKAKAAQRAKQLKAKQKAKFQAELDAAYQAGMQAAQTQAVIHPSAG